MMGLFSCFAAVLVFFLVVLLLSWRVQRKSSDKWPPISEDEFLRRCSPEVRPQTALKVRRIVAEQLGVPYEQVYPEQSFASDLGCG